MTTASDRMTSTAIAAALSLPLMFGAAWAQQAETSDQTSDGTTAQTQEADPSQGNGQAQSSAQQQSQQQSADSSAGEGGDAQANALVATVGGQEIRGSDLLTVIGTLPPQLRSQSPDMLIPIALEQLIMRELILERARSENLSQDPDVIALVTGATQTAEEDAMVQVWLDRELAKSVTDEAVQQSYDQAQQQGQQDLPPLADVRPQIEQHLRRQAAEELRTRLREGADIVLYDPAGQPIPDTQQGGQGSGTGDQAQASGASDTPGTADTMGSASDGTGNAAQAANSENAMRQAEQAGMQGVEAMQGTTILKGKSSTNADVYMIVGPTGELLALAAPLPGGSGTTEASTDGQEGSQQAPAKAGEPAESGFMATQAQPATPNMWDPAAIEQGMRQLELGTRGAAGEVGKP